MTGAAEVLEINVRNFEDMTEAEETLEAGEVPEAKWQKPRK